MLMRDARAGELHLLALALVIAVASVTTVGFFADRVERALSRQANQLLGGDLLLVSDRYWPEEYEARARGAGLSVARTARFPSMVTRVDRTASQLDAPPPQPTPRKGEGASAPGESVDRSVQSEEALLSQIRAVTPGYPLRGQLRIADTPFAEGHNAEAIPAPGTAWVDDKLYNRLHLEVGDAIKVGQARLNVAAVLLQEPDAAVGFLNLAPRLVLNYADLAATGLIQPGSRIRYQLLVAGEVSAVEDYREWAAARIGLGQRIESIRDARPEIRSALERAGSFLGLASLVAVILAAAAVALAARRFLQRHLDGCAIMRCLGASQGRILQLYVQQFVILGIVASMVGCVIGYGAQYVLANFLGSFVAADLPQASLLPALHGFAAGLLLLLGFALPPLVMLGKVPTLRVMRRELGAPGGVGVLGYLLGFGAISALILWKAYDLTLGLYMLAGFSAALVASGALVWLLLKLLRGANSGGISWRYGIANLRRRALGSVIQIVALALGIMALLVLTLIRGDLLNAWKGSLPPDAPNRFVINIQPDQLQTLAEFFAAKQISPPQFHPMVRGRLTAINGNKASPEDYADDRAKRLVDREFNLSWGQELGDDNRLIAGRWWDELEDEQEALLSVEEGIAETLSIKLGDTLTYDIAGQTLKAKVASLRKVDWDSFRVNFFVLAAPGVLDDYPASYVTSFHLPPERAGVLNDLVKSFPNMLVIDVAAVVTQVQKIMDQVVSAVEFVFLFTLASGLVVLFAALASTQDERVFEAAIMRALGASRRQLAKAQAAEFVAIGALAGLLAAAGASVLAFVVADRVLHLPYSGSPEVWAIGMVCGAAGVLLLGMLGTRVALNAPPLAILRRIA
ncbi:MAG: ABC transporter permease [Burkholderiales bacterium]|nr:ABC transporter permease [Burkholderiales bacterium]